MTVRLYEVIDTADQVFMIMEYASGGNSVQHLHFIIFTVYNQKKIYILLDRVVASSILITL